MSQELLADTEAHVQRLQGGQAPPIVSEVFSGETRLVSRWRNDPFEYDLPPLEDHIISDTHVGTGRASVKVGGQIVSAAARAGMISLWPRGHGGLWRVDGVIEASNIFLGRKRLQSCVDQVGNGRLPELRFDRIHYGDAKLFAIMRMINDEISAGDAISHLFVEHLVNLVCLQLIRTHSTTSTALSPGPRNGLADWQVKRVSTYMRDNLARDIRLQELADLLNLSRFHFCTAFRTATGCTPHQWLTNQRLSYAKQLLKDGTLRITEIALVVGYETPSAFSATFRRVIGLTPSEYRRRL